MNHINRSVPQRSPVQPSSSRDPHDIPSHEKEVTELASRIDAIAGDGLPTAPQQTSEEGWVSRAWSRVTSFFPTYAPEKKQEIPQNGEGFARSIQEELDVDQVSQAEAEGEPENTHAHSSQNGDGIFTRLTRWATGGINGWAKERSLGTLTSIQKSIVAYVNSMQESPAQIENLNKLREEITNRLGDSGCVEVCRVLSELIVDKLTQALINAATFPHDFDPSSEEWSKIVEIGKKCLPGMVVEELLKGKEESEGVADAIELAKRTLELNVLSSVRNLLNICDGLAKEHFIDHIALGVAKQINQSFEDLYDFAKNKQRLENKSPDLMQPNSTKDKAEFIDEPIGIESIQDFFKSRTQENQYVLFQELGKLCKQFTFPKDRQDLKFAFEFPTGTKIDGLLWIFERLQISVDKAEGPVGLARLFTWKYVEDWFEDTTQDTFHIVGDPSSPPINFSFPGLAQTGFEELFNEQTALRLIDKGLDLFEEWLDSQGGKKVASKNSSAVTIPEDHPLRKEVYKAVFHTLNLIQQNMTTFAAKTVLKLEKKRIAGAMTDLIVDEMCQIDLQEKIRWGINFGCEELLSNLSRSGKLPVDYKGHWVGEGKEKRWEITGADSKPLPDEEPKETEDLRKKINDRWTKLVSGEEKEVIKNGKRVKVRVKGKLRRVIPLFFKGRFKIDFNSNWISILTQILQSAFTFIISPICIVIAKLYYKSHRTDIERLGEKTFGTYQWGPDKQDKKGLGGLDLKGTGYAILHTAYQIRPIRANKEDRRQDA